MLPLARLNRLFAADGKCFNLALDHGFVNEYDLLAGVENMPAVVKTALDVMPDAIQLTCGQAHLLSDIRRGSSMPLVVRLDTTNVYRTDRPEYLFTQTIEAPLERALRLDAACVILNLFSMPDRPDVYHSCVRNITAVKAECERYGMPLMIEPLVMLPGSKGYHSAGDTKLIVALVRFAAELGCDIIKCEPTDNLCDFHKVVEAAGGLPVLPRGGGKIPEQEILERTYGLMQEGASGIVYGRNVFQHPRPAAITRAMMSVIHEGASPAQAMEFLK